jgi:hypothetical protein
MSFTRSCKQNVATIFLIFLFALLSGCGGGGGGGGGSVSPQGTGSVALLLTDAPADDFDEININVIKAELLSDSGRVTLFQGSRTFNLLHLTDAHMFALREGVPAGTYSKIRLTLASMQLVNYNGSDDPADDLVVYPKLPGNGKLDLNPQGDFRVAAGETLVLQLDMDANKSIHIVQKGNKQEYQFRPVVFVDIVTDAFHDRYVKLHGVIENIDAADGEFDLCDTNIPVRAADDSDATGSRGCVEVELASGTSVFDVNGAPAGFAELVEGDEATVFGRLQRDRDADDTEHEMGDRVLLAALIELGPEGAFQKLEGQALSAVNSDDRFTLDVDPGQGLTTPLQLTVQLQDGTRLINRKGEALDSWAIQNGRLVSVRGVLDIGTDTLLASLVLIDTDSSTQLTGTVGSNPDGSCGFTLMTATGDRGIRTAATTGVFLVTATSGSGSSEQIGVGQLTSGQEADVYGSEASDGCFDADTIIAFAAGVAP